MATTNKGKWEEIQRWCLEHKGHAFTVDVWSRHMSISDSVLSSLSGQLLREAKREYNAIASHFPGVKVSTKYGEIFGKTKGYTISLSVPERVSAQCYSEVYANEGFPFRDYLLAYRRDKLLEICKSYNFLTTYGPTYCVSCKGILDDYMETSKHREFKDFGMTNLESVAQCYGFAMAVFCVLQENIFLNKKITIQKIRHVVRYGEDFIELSAALLAAPPKLSKW